MKKLMKEYIKKQDKDNARLRSYVTRCVSQLDRLTSLSDYPSTLKVQRETYQSLGDQGEIIEGTGTDVRTVIGELTKKMNQMYPRRRFRGRKHFKANEMENLFKQERKRLCEAAKTLEGLKKQEKTMLKGFQTGVNDSQEHTLGSPMYRQQQDLRDVQTNIATAQQSWDQKEEIYIAGATRVFVQYQPLQKEILDLIQQTLVKFIEVIHPSQYSDSLKNKFDQIFNNVKTEQNSDNDLAAWATTHGVHTLVPAPAPITTIEINSQ